MILREPCQSTICAHRICQSCIEEQKTDLFFCPECNEQVSKDNLKLDRGCKNDMKSLNIACVLCDWSGMLKDYQIHLDQEHLKPKCNHCGTQFLTVYELINHQKSDCSQITIDCPLYSLGCLQKIRRKNFLDHIRSEEHQIVIMHFIRQCYPQQKQNNSVQNYREFIEKISKLLNDVNRLNDSMKEIRNTFNQIQSQYLLTNENIVGIQQSNDEQNKFVQNFTIKQEQMWNSILNIKDKSKDLLNKINEGIFYWKIDNIRDKQQIESYIESPSFYSSPTGYEMRLRLFLNGDNNARNTHISIHFILLRGEYDPILDFPFCFPVTICLYNQVDPQKHVVQQVQLDCGSDSIYFRRPQSDMNTPYPISKFVSLDDIKQENNPFIRDNVMFIKTFLEFRKIQNDQKEQPYGISPMYPPAIQQQKMWK